MGKNLKSGGNPSMPIILLNILAKTKALALIALSMNVIFYGILWYLVPLNEKVLM